MNICMYVLYVTALYLSYYYLAARYCPSRMRQGRPVRRPREQLRDVRHSADGRLSLRTHCIHTLCFLPRYSSTRTCLGRMVELIMYVLCVSTALLCVCVCVCMYVSRKCMYVCMYVFLMCLYVYICV